MTAKCRLSHALAMVALVVAACAAPNATVHWGTFTPTGSMLVARNHYTATLLQDGRVLLVGGDAGADVYASAELYDPKTGAFSATGSLQTARSWNTATLLGNGDVLVTGGYGGLAGRQLSTAELYEPKTGSFRSAGSMTTGRTGHTATLLQDGRVLIAGGQQGLNDDTGYLASAELYDPATGTFTATGSMTTQRSGHSATPLPDGRVLIAGGFGGVGSSAGVASAELYDPKTGTFIPTASMNTERTGHVAALLRGGSVLVVGKGASAELYDPKAGTFSPTGAMGDQAPQSATALADGRVLVLRGTDGVPELYDPSSGTFASTDETRLGWVRSATLLADGRVLITSGDVAPGTKAYIYQEP